MSKVKVEVRMNDTTVWVPLHETGITEYYDEARSLFDSEDDAEFAEWWDKLEEWRCVEV